MKKITLLLCFLTFLIGKSFAQKDSVQVAERLNGLMDVCRKIDFSDPNIMKLGVYYKAADFFIYKGADAERSLKAPIDYTQKMEKAYVDKACKSLNALLSHNSECVLGSFLKEEKMEGIVYSIDLLYRDSQYDGFSNRIFSFIKVGSKMFLIEVGE